MTCEDCLSALATASLRDMTPDSAVMQHCATCPDCSRLTTTLREREYEAATILNALPPMSNPLTVAENAVGIAKRRRMGRVVVMMTGAALVATIWIVAATLVIPALNQGDMRRASTLRTETMQLSCLSPQQAADIINPYVRKRGSTYYLPSSGISAITVRGTPDELAKSRDLIAHFERDPSAACRNDAATIRKLQDQVIHDVESRSGGVVVTPNPAPPKK
jgi:type II secretory pathway component GspD/PulD (secretin)